MGRPRPESNPILGTFWPAARTESLHNASEILFRPRANTDPQREGIFSKGPAEVLDHATKEIAIGSKLGIDSTEKLPVEARRFPSP